MIRSRSDAEIWRELQSLHERTGWPASAVIDAIAADWELPRDRVKQIWIERATMGGAG